MLANTVVNLAQTFDYGYMLMSIGVMTVVLIGMVAVFGFVYIWTTVADIMKTVNEIYEIVDNDDDENATKKKEKSDNE